MIQSLVKCSLALGGGGDEAVVKCSLALRGGWGRGCGEVIIIAPVKLIGASLTILLPVKV